MLSIGKSAEVKNMQQKRRMWQFNKDKRKQKFSAGCQDFMFTNKHGTEKLELWDLKALNSFQRYFFIKTVYFELRHLTTMLHSSLNRFKCKCVFLLFVIRSVWRRTNARNIFRLIKPNFHISLSQQRSTTVSSKAIICFSCNFVTHDTTRPQVIKINTIPRGIGYSEQL